MSRKTRATSIKGAFVPHLLEMLTSPAFQVLSYSAHRALIRIEIEHMQHGGQENGRLLATYDQLQEMGIHRDSIAPSLRELAVLGFVEITQKGKPNSGEYKWPNLFRLTYLPTKDGVTWKEATHEWRSIQSPEHAAMLAKAARDSSSRHRKKQKEPERKMPILISVNGVSVG